MKHKKRFLLLIGSLVLLSGCAFTSKKAATKETNHAAISQQEAGKSKVNGTWQSVDEDQVTYTILTTKKELKIQRKQPNDPVKTSKYTITSSQKENGHSTIRASNNEETLYLIENDSTTWTMGGEYKTAGTSAWQIQVKRVDK